MAGPQLEPGNEERRGREETEEAGWQEDKEGGRKDRRKKGEREEREERNLSMYHVTSPCQKPRQAATPLKQSLLAY